MKLKPIPQKIKLNFRVTQAMLTAIRKAANRAGLRMSDWVREALKAALDRGQP